MSDLTERAFQSKDWVRNHLGAMRIDVGDSNVVWLLSWDGCMAPKREQIRSVVVEYRDNGPPRALITTDLGPYKTVLHRDDVHKIVALGESLERNY